MAQAISNKVLVDTTNYCWMVCDYTVTGMTLDYTLTFHYDKGCAQLDGAYIRDNGTDIWANAGRVHSFEGSLTYSHDVAIHSGSATLGAGNHTITFGITKYNGVALAGSFNVTGGSAPTGLQVSVDSYTDTSATFDASITSWGSPVAATGKYLEAAILTGNTYMQNPRRWNVEYDETEAFIPVDNSSYTGTPALTIQGNTQYYYGMYANNGTLFTSTVPGTFVTKPAYITGVTAVDLHHHNIECTVLHDQEGSQYTVTDEYSFDEVNWTPFFDTITIVVPSARTIYFRRSSTAGITPTYSIYVEPTPLGIAYGSVNNQSEEIVKWYGSVNNQSKKIVKMYGSKNGLSKMIYEGVS